MLSVNSLYKETTFTYQPLALVVAGIHSAAGIHNPAEVEDMLHLESMPHLEADMHHLEALGTQPPSAQLVDKEAGVADLGPSLGKGEAGPSCKHHRLKCK